MAVALISGIVSEDNNRRDNETSRIETDAYDARLACTDPDPQ
jgi:hypothetical protein